MKLLIKKLLRESINLNLSKQLRKTQLKTYTDSVLEELFGKNVYRLYYDLDTGKQVFPNPKRVTKLKFDVDIVDNLKNKINSLLKKLDYTLVDFEKNLAKNDKTNQQIKISKAINNSDNALEKEYNEFLTSLPKKYEEGEKLLVVISRHSHDIGSMSAKPNITSCENISSYTDISQLNQLDSSVGEGEGIGILNAIDTGKLVFYLIKENDLNIQDPISRFLQGRICEFGNKFNFYGKYHNNFKNFINGWLRNYYKKIKKDDVEFEDDFYSKSSEEIIKVLRNTSKEQGDNIIRQIISHERYDVLYDMMHSSEYNIVNNKAVETKILNEESINNLLSWLSSIFGYKIINKLPDKIKKPFFDLIKKKAEHSLDNIKFTYNILFNDLKITDNNKKISELIPKQNLLNMLLEKSNFNIPYPDLLKVIDVDLYNQLTRYYSKIKTLQDSDKHKLIRQYVDKIYNN
jgi:hypothetical protein